MSSHSVSSIVGGCAIALVSVSYSASTSGQSWVEDSGCPDNTPIEFHRCALDAAESFDPPLTADGLPDLGGNWILPGGQTGGPYEDLEAHGEELDAVGGAAAIVDPDNGVLPIQPWAEAQVEVNSAQFIHHNAACLLAGVPNTMYHGGARQFMQSRDSLAITSYNTHAYRIVHLDGRPPLDENIRLWNGDSRGRWDGNTLVVETTNQNARPWLDQRGRFYTIEAEITERFTLIDPNTIHYQATVVDPNVFTRPFTIALPYRRITDDPYEMEELACYENNEELLQIYRDVGYGIFPGVSPEQARDEAANR
ncbi:MAG: hypothetical protein ACJ0SL_06650 [Candidatus Rariloculaceae bacterium]